MNTHAVRDRAMLRAEYDAVAATQREADSPEFRRFLDGARAALEWVLGCALTAPATAAVEPATAARMEREERYCDRIIYSPEPRPALDPDYANGVEHALAWARGAEDEPPTPAALPEEAAVCTCHWRAA
jgi:hypothetical protein